ncbi:MULTISPECIES: PTS sugar transporter subunit IIA [unclassified Breznakia]|uniref:BglG family transcription antiterminator n=1 Tax=unclassified Breznakia TaxID=2623764 RepID=UPI00247601F5|nr:MULTISPECIES: PTS sugar transporter subunit IIA [unclassified Breznakia]MDH6366561.1 lichenan operon transcriptional antiterminator [Breznakia sp. PH1-1]MDH6403654.1 lichenan operon transcriptional antiterminator [Breznakia sp. PF1-11]MDH6411363.1 lichenan operon transcriptional antiterminator [Breznakia sp. PFB1-11]MDH6413661.1 lichenan operon transcriptional antiterminator [Breznakia sp. PFB1-14]MDH6415908.1 lichenan operon transcriptional antiterminator [Breznakia sp. PFB1-4]
MRENRTTKLIEYLILSNNTWIPAKQIAGHLGVSTRQVRKYITTINNTSDDFNLILSGKEGYKIADQHYDDYCKALTTQKNFSPQQRQDYIIQKLIASPKGYDIFTISEELYVSVPTIERDLKSIRSFLISHNLTLLRNGDILLLEGEEKDKRSMMSHLLSSKEYNSFVLQDKVQLLSYHYHLWEFRNNIHQILTDNKVFTNDYSLNDIALHLIIMIDRIRSDCMLDTPIDIKELETSDIYLATRNIVTFIENEYEIAVNDAEFYQLFLIVANNSITVDAGKINQENLEEYIDKRFLTITETILENIAKTYYLNPFDQSFRVKMALHLWALYRRISNDKFAKNPLTKQVKSTYPLIYDIAVYFAQELEHTFNTDINEDEIAYLAFHIGSYFENNAKSEKRLCCMFVYMEYHNTHQITMERVQQIFEDKIHIQYALPLSRYKPLEEEVDLIISTVDLDFPYSSVIISPFITEKELSKLRIAIDRELQNKRKKALISYLESFVDEELFYAHANFSSATQAIKDMGADLYRLGYVEEGFIDDVLQREKTSSTVFGNVAVPHALSSKAKKGFISFAICNPPLRWNENDVHIIVMLGISNDSRKQFADIFDYLVDVIAESEYVEQLVALTLYDEFIDKLIEFIHQKLVVS